LARGRLALGHILLLVSFFQCYILVFLASTPDALLSWPLTTSLIETSLPLPLLLSP
jgi:hypothetical protein